LHPFCRLSPGVEAVIVSMRCVTDCDGRNAFHLYVKGIIMSEGSRFSYDVAFSRNIGWATEAEQEKLRQTRVAVGGLGGVGGSHL
jgi:hypothetical protein